MEVRVLVFAMLIDRVGSKEVTVQVADDATVGDLKNQMVESWPDLAGAMDTIATAVNMTYVKQDHRLSADDEVALIPPVSGG